MTCVLNLVLHCFSVYEQRPKGRFLRNISWGPLKSPAFFDTWHVLDENPRFLFTVMVKTEKKKSTPYFWSPLKLKKDIELTLFKKTTLCNHIQKNKGVKLHGQKRRKKENLYKTGKLNSLKRKPLFKPSVSFTLESEQSFDWFP